ncbi:glutaredoxin family protein [Candidatus Bathyarchaeota archaeon]|nr:glutaredoxin family protein [Candidatus Bathyarchaeota archaeon]
MRTTKVHGKNRSHSVRLYTLSTCVWCKRTKEFLNENDVEYEYVDIDLCTDEEREEARKTILSKGGRISFPAIIIDGKLINGFHEDKIKEALKLGHG